MCLCHIMENKTRRKKYGCPVEGCKASFPRPSKLAIHVKLHEGEKPFQCEVSTCNKSYTTKAHLKRHQDTQHGEPTSTKTLCTIEGCNKEFSTVGNMQKHLKRAHNPNRIYRYTCNECNQSFPKKKLLHQHSYLHTGQFYYTCDLCGRGFHLLSELNRHRSSHASYACDKCKEVFKTWSNMQRHKKLHRVLFKCGLCSYKSYRKVLMKSHEVTHLDIEKRARFTCPYESCLRSYLYKRNLQQHIKIVHMMYEKVKLKCPARGCRAKLSGMVCLKKHIQTIHDESRSRMRKLRLARQDRGKPRANVFVQLIGSQLEERADFPTQNSTLVT